MRENFVRKKSVRKQRFVAAFFSYPILVVFLIILRELHICLNFLLLQYLEYARIFAFRQLKLPINQLFVKLNPLLAIHIAHKLQADVAKLLLIVHCRLLAYQPLCVQVFFEGKQNLIGIYRFDEIVRNLAAYGLLHDVFFFAFGNHDYRKSGIAVLYHVQHFQARKSGHIFVQKHYVYRLVSQHFKCFIAVYCRCYRIALGFQKKNIGFEQIYLVIYPQNIDHKKIQLY